MYFFSVYQHSGGYSTYHTAYDTYEYAYDRIDPGFVAAKMVTEMTAAFIIRLAHREHIPLNFTSTVDLMWKYYRNIDDDMQVHLTRFKLDETIKKLYI